MSKKVLVMGLAIDSRTRKRGVGMRIEAWDPERMEEGPLAKTAANERGAFRFTFDSEWLFEHYAQRTMFIRFRAYQEDVLYADQVVEAVFQGGEMDLNIDVNFEKPYVPPEPIVAPPPEPPPAPAPVVALPPQIIVNVPPPVEQKLPAPPVTVAVTRTRALTDHAQPELHTLRAAGQLVDQASGSPLSGYTLRVLSDEGVELAFDVTTPEGLFVLVAGDRDAERLARAQQARITVRLTSPDGKEAGTIETAWPEAGAPLSIALAASASRGTSPSIVDVGRIANLSLPHGLLRVFVENGVHTLADLRRQGGVQNLGRLPIGADHPAIRAIEAHATLSTLSSDLELNAILIDKGYLSALKVASTPRADFLTALGDKVGDVRAAQVHAAAIAQVAVVDEIVVGLQAEQALGAKAALPNVTLPAALTDGLVDSDSRVAHLADLLQVAVQRLRRDHGAVSVTDLVEMLGQPLDQLLVIGDDGDAGEEPRESRLAIEVLRRYLGAKETPPQYLEAAYRALLSRFGSSPTELRLALSSAEQRAEVARTLGIATDGSVEANLGSLLLRADLPDGHAQALTEDTLERRFGLRSTTNRPLSQGAVFGDGQDQIRRYHLDGVAWSRNTDEDGTLYLRLKRGAGAGARVSLFKDRSRTQLVAAGESHGVGVTIGLAEQNGSGLSGWVELLFTAESDTIELQPIPQILAYRLARVEQAGDADARRGGDPVIDPDLLSPADFRLPYPHNPAFELWRKRRTWIDRQLTELLNLPSLSAMFDTMYKQGGASYGSTYPAAPWNDTTPSSAFEQLADDLLLPLRAAAVESRIRHDLGLARGEFERLAALAAAERGRKLEADERAEGASLLIVAHKRSLAATWTDEEHNLRVDAHPELFWPALVEPEVGAWPPPATELRLDPDDVVTRPEGLYGQRARMILDSRRGQLRRRHRELRRTFEKEGAAGLFAQLFGNAVEGLTKAIADKAAEAPPELQLLTGEYHALQALAAPESKTQWDARAPFVFAIDRRRNLLPRWIEEETNLSLDYWQTHAAMLPPWRATPAQRLAWTEGLTAAMRPSLIDPEAILVDELWQPLGGAAAELLNERRTWLAGRRADAERTRFQSGSGLAAFDTLVLGSLAASGKITMQEGVRAEIKAVRQQLGVEPAIEVALGLANSDLDVWKARLSDSELRAATEEQIVNYLYLSVEQFERLLVLRGYSQSGSASAAAGDELDAMLSAALVLRSIFSPGAELADSRLAQLGLDEETTAVMRRLRLAAKHGPLGEAEVGELMRALLLAERARLGWRWRKEEAERGVSPSPIWFRLGEESDVPPSAAVSHPALRQRWRETLAERTAEHERLAEDHFAIVDAVEEQLFASLYDGIVLRSTIPGGSLLRRREWVARNLRLPVQTNHDARTTRVEFAARALWSLCQGARSGELGKEPLHLTVAPGSGEALAAVESYDAWRTQRAAQLFPERTIDLATGTHSALFADLHTRLDAANDAADVAGALSAYSAALHDRAAIRVEAAAHATTGRAAAGQARSQLLILGRDPHADHRWFATIDTDLPSRLQLSEWQPVPSLNLPGDVLGIARRHGELVVVAISERDLWLLPYDPRTGAFLAVENLVLPRAYESVVLVDQVEGVALTARRPDGAIVGLKVDGRRVAETRLFVPATLGRHYPIVAAHVYLADRGSFLVLGSSAGELHYRWLGAADDGRLRSLAAGTFVGTTTLGRGVEAWWRRDDLVFRRRITPGATAPQPIAGLSAISDWLLEATGIDLKSRYATTGFGAGRPLLGLLTSELLTDELRDSVLGALTAEATSQPDSELGQVDQIVQRFSGRGLAALIKAALEGATVELPVRDDAIELMPPLAEQSGTVGAPAMSGVTRRIEVGAGNDEGWVVLERAGRSLLASRRIEGEREHLGEALPLQLELQPILEAAGPLAVAPSVGRWDLGADDPALLRSIGASLVQTRDRIPHVHAQTIEEAFLAAPLAAAATLRRLAETRPADRIEQVALVDYFDAAAQSLPRLGDHHATTTDRTLGRPGALPRAAALQKVERLVTSARLSEGAERRRLFAEAAQALDQLGAKRVAAGTRFLALEWEAPTEWAATSTRLLRRLLLMPRAGAVDAVFEDVKAALASDAGWDIRLRKLADLTARAEALAIENRRIVALVEETNETLATAHELLLNEPAVSEAARRAAERVSAEVGRTAAALLGQTPAQLRAASEQQPWFRAAAAKPTAKTALVTDGQVLVTDGLRRAALPIAARLPADRESSNRPLPPQTGVHLVRPAILVALAAEIEAELGLFGTPLAESPSEWLSQTQRELERLHDEALTTPRQNGWRATLAELDSDWARARRAHAAAARFSAWQRAAHAAEDLESLEAVQRHFPLLDD